LRLQHRSGKQQQHRDCRTDVLHVIPPCLSERTVACPRQVIRSIA
jgi:hypothetical protein